MFKYWSTECNVPHMLKQIYCQVLITMLMIKYFTTIITLLYGRTQLAYSTAWLACRFGDKDPFLLTILRFLHHQAIYLDDLTNIPPFPQICSPQMLKNSQKEYLV